MSSPPDLNFKVNTQPTVGVELEMQLVDAHTLALKSAISEVLEKLPESFRGQIKPELMQCYLEINSKTGYTINDVVSDLESKTKAVVDAAETINGRIAWGGTHPFSMWMDQEISPDERYHKLIEVMQDIARRVVIFGMHVHVGLDSGDKAIMMVDRLQRHLPSLLAMSVNSPFWAGRDTGLKSYRSKIMEQLPAAGLPPIMRNWSEYCWVVRHSIATGFINSIREIWWDVRPHPGFGTVEIRIMDVPNSMEEVAALAAYCQCLVVALSEQIDRGLYQHDIHPLTVRQNKWKAARFGLDAQFIDPLTFKTTPARELVRSNVEYLRPYGKDLQCVDELDSILKILENPSGAHRQIEYFNGSGDLQEVVRQLILSNPLTAR